MITQYCDNCDDELESEQVLTQSNLCTSCYQEPESLNIEIPLYHLFDGEYPRYIMNPRKDYDVAATNEYFRIGIIHELSCNGYKVSNFTFTTIDWIKVLGINEDNELVNCPDDIQNQVEDIIHEYADNTFNGYVAKQAKPEVNEAVDQPATRDEADEPEDPAHNYCENCRKELSNQTPDNTDRLCHDCGEQYDKEYDKEWYETVIEDKTSEAGEPEQDDTPMTTPLGDIPTDCERCNTYLDGSDICEKCGHAQTGWQYAEEAALNRWIDATHEEAMRVMSLGQMAELLTSDEVEAREPEEVDTPININFDNVKMASWRTWSTKVVTITYKDDTIEDYHHADDEDYHDADEDYNYDYESALELVEAAAKKRRLMKRQLGGNWQGGFYVYYFVPEAPKKLSDAQRRGLIDLRKHQLRSWNNPDYDGVRLSSCEFRQATLDKLIEYGYVETTQTDKYNFQISILGGEKALELYPELEFETWEVAQDKLDQERQQHEDEQNQSNSELEAALPELPSKTSVIITQNYFASHKNIVILETVAHDKDHWMKLSIGFAGVDISGTAIRNPMKMVEMLQWAIRVQDILDNWGNDPDPATSLDSEAEEPGGSWK